MIKQEYNRLKKKYNLPDFNKLDKEFEISTIDPNLFSIRAVRRKMLEKLIFFSKILETTLFPNLESLSTMYESRFFSEEDKDKISETYRVVMLHSRRFLKADVNPEDKTDAKLIKDLSKDWPKIKDKVGQLVNKMEACWNKKDVKIKDLIYFG